MRFLRRPLEKEMSAQHSQIAPTPPHGELQSAITHALAGRYTILHTLAQGGTAVLFLARHPVLSSLFVVRVLLPSLAGDPSVLAHFRSEGLIGAGLSGHPHVLPIVDAGEALGLPYMVMPYVEGEDLDRLLFRLGRLSYADTLLLAMQVADALHYASRLGILHGDLSPGNLRINRFGMVIVFDFGLMRTEVSAQSPAVAEQFHRSMATPLYISPERIRAQPFDIRSDLYSLGAVLYEALTGVAAFHGDTLEQIEQRHLAGDVDFSHRELQTHPEFQQLLKQLLALDPDSRIASPADLQASLARLAPSLPRIAAEVDASCTVIRRSRLSAAH